MEAMHAQDHEVLFLYENFDELVLMNLGQFDKKTLTSVENELASITNDKASPAADKAAAGNRPSILGAELLNGLGIEQMVRILTNIALW